MDRRTKQKDEIKNYNGRWVSKHNNIKLYKKIQ